MFDVCALQPSRMRTLLPSVPVARQRSAGQTGLISLKQRACVSRGPLRVHDASGRHLPRSAGLHHGGSGQHRGGGDLRAGGQRLRGAAARDQPRPQGERGAAEETAAHGAPGSPVGRPESRF